MRNSNTDRVDGHPPPDTKMEPARAGSEGQPAGVHLRFPNAAGKRLCRPEPTNCPEEGPFWTERPVLMKRADGTYELIGTSRNLEGLARWVLSFGTSVEVRCPKRLQRQVALQARRIWRQYDTDSRVS